MKNEEIIEIVKETCNRPLGWTTLEEAKLLIEAGLDPTTADMCYITKYRWYTKETVFEKYGEKAFYVEVLNRDQTDFYPCWSIGALMYIVEEVFKKDLSYENKKWIVNTFDEDFALKRPCCSEILSKLVIHILNNNRYIE